MLHPFAADRQIGSVYRVDAEGAEVTLPRAAARPQMHLGQRVPRGEVAEFVVIDVGGFGIVGRIREVWVSANDRRRVADGIDPATPIAPFGAVQLLATLRLDGTHIRGIEKYPRLGDPVYSAPPDVLEALISEEARAEGPRLSIGTLANDDQVAVDIDPSRLFGRHLAVLGATGSGKSWTLAHLAEEIQGISGKLIIIDATGEFHTLGGSTTHVSVSSTELALPHTDMDEADLTAFLRPSVGSQLPKLREAIRSLRLAEVIGRDHPLVDERGLIRKADKRRSDFYDLRNEYADVVESAGSKFNLRLLGEQIECECIWAHGRQNDGLFGGPDLNGLGYCVSLITRIQDLTQTPEIVEIVSPITERASVIAAIDSFLANAEERVLCISLKDLPFVHYMREITVNAIGRHLLSLARRGKFRPSPVVVAVDEAQQFFGRVIGDEIITTRLEHFEAIAKEGRKYGLTVCMATQRPGDLPSGVLSQAGMLLVHRLGHGRDRKYVEEASSELDRSATQLLPGLTPGEAVLVGVDFPVPISVRIAAPLRKPESEGPNYRVGWQASPTPT